MRNSTSYKANSIFSKGVIMNGDYLTNDYCWWIEGLVTSDNHTGDGYSMLIERLYRTDFVWYIRNDENRAADGKHLRRQYADQCGMYISEYFYDPPASVLEVLAALAIRCEVDIMAEPGDEHPDKWFWLYLENLGLLKFNDSNFDALQVDRIVSDWLHRRYDHDGFGGIFPIDGCLIDQRESEIWVQMHQYLLHNYMV